MNNLSPIQIWRKALTQPNLATFEEITNDPSISLGKGLIWIASSGFIRGFILNIFNNDPLSQIKDTLSYLGFTFQDFRPSILSVLGSAFFLMIVNVIAAMMITGIMQIAADMLNGTGEFDELFYAYAAIFSPILVINAFLLVIPYVGCIAPLFYLYGLGLMVIVNQVVHNFNAAKSVVCTLLPFLMLYLFCICGTIVMGMIGSTGYASSALLGYLIKPARIESPYNLLNIKMQSRL